MKRVIAFSLAALMLLFCACGKTAEAKPLADVFNDIKAQVSFENITELKEARQLDRRYGITEDMVAEFAGCNNATRPRQPPSRKSSTSAMSPSSTRAGITTPSRLPSWRNAP